MASKKSTEEEMNHLRASPYVLEASFVMKEDRGPNHALT